MGLLNRYWPNYDTINGKWSSLENPPIGDGAKKNAAACFTDRVTPWMLGNQPSRNASLASWLLYPRCCCCHHATHLSCWRVTCMQTKHQVWCTKAVIKPGTKSFLFPSNLHGHGLCWDPPHSHLSLCVAVERPWLPVWSPCSHHSQSSVATIQRC